MPPPNTVTVTLQLQGTSQFLSQAAAAAAGIGSVGTASQQAGQQSQAAAGHQGRFLKVMGKVGRAGALGAAALGAAGVAAAGMGVQYNASMEQTRAALTQFLGSTSAADDMIGKLQDLNKKTPFEFPELVGTTRSLLAMGFNANEAYEATSKLGDAVAAMGGGGEELKRVSLVLGQIRAKGRLQAEELMQLAEAGVTSYQSLADQMGISVDTLQDRMKKGQLGAKDALGAIMGDWQKRFGGAAEAQSKTFNGMVSNLKDAFNQMLGEATKPLFEYLRDVALPALAAATPQIASMSKTIGDELVPAIKGVLDVIGAMITAFQWIQKNWPDIVVVAGALTIGLVAMNAQIIALNIGIAVLNGIVRAITIAQLAWNAVITANPIGLIIMAIALLVAGFVIAYRHSERFRNIVNAIWTWIKDHWKLLVVLLVGPIGIAIVKIIEHWKDIKKAVAPVMEWLGGALKTLAGIAEDVAKIIGDVFGAVWGFIKNVFGKIDSLVSKIPGGWKTLGTIALGPLGAAGKLAGVFADGGPVTRTGSYLVGERGPEVVSLHSGSHVYPTPALAATGMGNMLEPRQAQTVVAKVYLDKRQIAEAVGQYTADSKARR